MRNLFMYSMLAFLVFLSACSKKTDTKPCTAKGKQVTYEILSITGGCSTSQMAQWVNATGNYDYVYSSAGPGFKKTITIDQAGAGCGISFLTIAGSGCEITSRILVNGVEVKRGTGGNTTLIYTF